MGFALVLVVVFGELVSWFGGTFYSPRWVVTVLEGLINVVLLSVLVLWVRDDTLPGGVMCGSILVLVCVAAGGSI